MGNSGGDGGPSSEQHILEKKKKFETYSGKCEFAKYSGESEFETLQVKLLQELCTKQAEGRMSVVVISDQEKFR